MFLSEKKIDEVELKKLKDKLDKNEITLEDYKKEYKNLEDKSFNMRSIRSLFRTID